MADSRIRGLAGEVLAANIQALLDTLYLAVDDASFTDAKKILLKTILTNAIVADNSIDYQALTPKGFNASVMTTARKGIGQLAEDAAVTSKTGTGLLNSLHQVLMQAQWKKDWFEQNGLPGIIAKDTSDAVYSSFSYDFNTYEAITSAANEEIDLLPTLPQYKKINAMAYTLVITGPNTGQQIVLFSSKITTGSNIVETISSISAQLIFTGDGKRFYLAFNGYQGQYIGVSMHINGTLKTA